MSPPAEGPGTAACPGQQAAARRLFFAFWPAEAERQGIAAAVRDAAAVAGARPVPPRNYHITLAFLGTVPGARLRDVQAIAADVAARHRRPAGCPVQLVLDRLVWWRSPRVLVATAEGESPAAIALARDLQASLAASGFHPDLKPFCPHVTVARKVSRATTGTGALSVLLSFGGFALVDSVTESGGSVYSVVDSWGLCDG